MNKNTIIISLFSILACLSLHGMEPRVESKESKPKIQTTQQSHSNPLFNVLRQHETAAEHKEQTTTNTQQSAPVPQKSVQPVDSVKEQLKKHVAWVLQEQTNYEKSVLKVHLQSNNIKELIPLLCQYAEECTPLIRLMLQQNDYTSFKALINAMQEAYEQTKESQCLALAQDLIRYGLNYAIVHSDKKLFTSIRHDYNTHAYALIQGLIIKDKLDTLQKAINLGLNILDYPKDIHSSIFEHDLPQKNRSLLRIALEKGKLKAIHLLLKNTPKSYIETIADSIEERGFFIYPNECDIWRFMVSPLDPKSPLLPLFSLLQKIFQKQIFTLLKNNPDALKPEENKFIQAAQSAFDKQIMVIANKNEDNPKLKTKFATIFYDMVMRLHATLMGIHDPLYTLPEATASTFAANIILHTTAITSPQRTTHALQLPSSPSVNEPSSPSSSTSSTLSFSVSPIISPTLSSEFRPQLAMRGNREMPSITGVFAVPSVIAFAKYMTAESKL
jgi:hypothetical protein